MSKPNFFIVGAPKAGTTSLHAWLDQHPDVFLPAQKEPDYFTHAELDAQQLYYGNTQSVRTEAAYLNLFAGAGTAKAVGEASVSSLFYPQVAERIYEFNPAARIVIVLRDPVDRAWSHFRMDQRLGFVEAELDDIFAGTSGHAQQANYFQQYIELGNYAQQVKRYLDVFGPNQVWIKLYQSDMAALLPGLLTFLGVDATLDLDTETRHNKGGEAKSTFVGKLYRQPALRKMVSAAVPSGARERLRNGLFDSGSHDKMPEKLGAALKSYYAPGVVELETLLGHKCWDY